MRVLALHKLQSEILSLQGLRPAQNPIIDLTLGPLRNAFPNTSFPTAAIHEFITENKETAAVTTGFISGILSSLMKPTSRQAGTVMWIGTSPKIFPPALKTFGIEPDRFIFVDIKKEKDIAWAMDEALKCDALSAVVGEMQDLSFTESRRLQLAVEKSRVTGFVLRTNPRKIGTTACVSRWKITSLHSGSIDGMPGVGSPQWKVELLRIRNGKPGTWELRWENGNFSSVGKEVSKEAEIKHLKAI
jgi:protein ImuA